MGSHWRWRTLFFLALPTAARAFAAAASRPGLTELRRFALGPCEGKVPLHEALHTVEPEAFPTLTAARRAIRRGLILVEGGAASSGQLVSGGEVVSLLCRAGATAGAQDDGVSAAAASHAGQNGHAQDAARLEVIFEDDELAVVVKPQGMPTQDAPASGSAHALSAWSLLPRSLRPSPLDGRLARPRHVHRLDAPTGGLLVVAKTQHALVQLSRAFCSRAVLKTYRAVVACDCAPLPVDTAVASSAFGLLAAHSGFPPDPSPCPNPAVVNVDAAERPGAIGGVAQAIGAGSRGAPAAGAEGGGGGSGAWHPPLPSHGECTVPLGGKAAITHFTVLRRYEPPQQQPRAAPSAAAASRAGGTAALAAAPQAAAEPAAGRSAREASTAGHSCLALVELRPLTGRTHQLRRHASALGYPIVGETKKYYASAAFRAASPSGHGLFLWATRVRFDHPTTGERLDFERLPPAHFDAWPEAAGAALDPAAQLLAAPAG